MGFDLNALAAKTAVVTVTFMGQTATVMYNPSLLTQENITTAQQGGDQAFVGFFTELVKDWDVKRGTKKVPLTETGLKGVPIPFLKSVFTAIYLDARADPEAGKPSSDG